MALKPIVGEIKSQDLNDNFSYLDERIVEGAQDPRVDDLIADLNAHLADMTAHGVNTKVSKNGDVINGSLDINTTTLLLKLDVARDISSVPLTFLRHGVELWRFTLDSSNNLILTDVVGGSSFRLNGVSIAQGSGSPEGVLQAPPGSIYQRTDGGASTTLYVKESGTGNTGWKAVQTA